MPRQDQGRPRRRQLMLLPISAAVARHIFGGGAAHFGGGGRAAFHAPAGRSFSSHAGSRSFTAHAARRSFAPHTNSHVTNFAHTHHGTTFNSASVPNRNLRGRTHNGNIATHNAGSNALRSHANANANANANGRFAHRNATGGVTPLAARNGR